MNRLYTIPSQSEPHVNRELVVKKFVLPVVSLFLVLLTARRNEFKVHASKLLARKTRTCPSRHVDPFGALINIPLEHPFFYWKALNPTVEYSNPRVSFVRCPMCQ